MSYSDVIQKNTISCEQAERIANEYHPGAVLDENLALNMALSVMMGEYDRLSDERHIDELARNGQTDEGVVLVGLALNTLRKMINPGNKNESAGEPCHYCGCPSVSYGAFDEPVCSDCGGN